MYVRVRCVASCKDNHDLAENASKKDLHSFPHNDMCLHPKDSHLALPIQQL